MNKFKLFPFTLRKVYALISTKISLAKTTMSYCY